MKLSYNWETMPLLETTDNQIKIPQPRLDYHFGVVSHRGSINFHYRQTIAIVRIPAIMGYCHSP